MEEFGSAPPGLGHPGGAAFYWGMRRRNSSGSSAAQLRGPILYVSSPCVSDGTENNQLMTDLPIGVGYRRLRLAGRVPSTPRARVAASASNATPNRAPGWA
jgi:hypothetical protein